MSTRLTNNNSKSKVKKKKKRISPSVTALIGTIIIIVGGFFLSYNYIHSKKVMVYDYMNNVFYADGNAVEQEKENLITEDSEVPNASYDITQYVGYLSIPKINLNKGFYPKDSPYNDVEKNLLLVKESSYPNEALGNLIIAAHSGTGWKAFFNDLYKLEVGDYAYVDYNNKKYTYKIDNIYKQNKTGTIAIYRDYTKTTLTLVTCTNFDDKTQTVYIAYLEKVE